MPSLIERILGIHDDEYCGFIASLVQKLLIELCQKWVSEALKIQMKSGTLDGFANFARFIIGKSVQANSTYYKAVFLARSTRVIAMFLRRKKRLRLPLRHP